MRSNTTLKQQIQKFLFDCYITKKQQTKTKEKEKKEIKIKIEENKEK